MAAQAERSTTSALAADLREARGRILALVTDLEEADLVGPELEIVNPPLWEVGHVAWFAERWLLRRLHGRSPLMEDPDRFYDSIAIEHPSRYRLELPRLPETLDYAARVAAAVDELLERDGGSPELEYFARLALYHEDMHVEAMLYTRQTLGLRAPTFLAEETTHSPPREPAEGDVRIPGGIFLLGADPGDGFVFDNEKWAHPVELAPFEVARRAVTQGELAAFVEDGGYEDRRLWSEEGWAWREAAGARHPVHWRGGPSAWERRVFDRWVPLEPELVACHVNLHEAEAWCRWADRRLPTEAEWEAVATLDPDTGAKRARPWGPAEAEDADGRRANLDLACPGPIAADALPAGDSAAGCRQLWGNVWEWTSSVFQPFPGFVRDPYEEYSEPWFGTRRVLRGGSWATRGRMLRSTWRNYFTPDRRDVYAGFRTCAR